MGSWFTGDMSPRARVFTALLPAVITSAYFLGGYAVYVVRALIWGQPHQWDKDVRGRTAILGHHLRLYFFWVINPLWRLLLASGISANTVTAVAAAA